MIPQRYRGVSGPVPAAFSLHAVVRTGTQRRGLFRQLGQEVIDAAEAAGWQFASGVCNEKSIGTVVKYLDWKTPGPLPVRICIPVSLGPRHRELRGRRRVPRRRPCSISRPGSTRSP